MDALASIERLYDSALPAQPIDHAAFVEKLSNWAIRYSDFNFLHPCLIDGQRALVCEKDLHRKNPEAFDELSRICGFYGIFLKEDERTQSPASHYVERRQKNPIILALCFGLLIALTTTQAETSAGESISLTMTSRHVKPSNRLHAVKFDNKGKTVLRLIRSAPPVTSTRIERPSVKPDLPAQARIERLLRQSYVKQAGDPIDIRQDLNNMARYYARYPAAIELLKALENKRLKLRYRKETWQTQAHGGHLNVDSATVYFDTRIGARLWLHSDCKGNPACHISPADALLHELLHAKIMLTESKRFIASGGMKPTLYLFDHEHEVIKKEFKLFDAMNRTDGMSRPLRQRHTGRLIKVECAICLPGDNLIASTE